MGPVGRSSASSPPNFRGHHGSQGSHFRSTETLQGHHRSAESLHAPRSRPGVARSMHASTEFSETGSSLVPRAAARRDASRAGPTAETSPASSGGSGGLPRLQARSRSRSILSTGQQGPDRDDPATLSPLPAVPRNRSQGSLPPSTTQSPAAPMQRHRSSPVAGAPPRHPPSSASPTPGQGVSQPLPARRSGPPGPGDRPSHRRAPSDATLECSPGPSAGDGPLRTSHRNLSARDLGAGQERPASAAAVDRRASASLEDGPGPGPMRGSAPGVEGGGTERLPPAFLCPISMELMRDPVVLDTGHFYERAHIKRWLKQGHRSCPTTGQHLRHLELTPNHALRIAIEEWCGQHGVEVPPRVPECFEREDLGSLMAEEGAGGGADRGAEARAAGVGVVDQVVLGHQEIVWAVEGAGQTVVTASADRTLRAWDVPAQRCVGIAEGHSRPVLCLAVSDRMVFSGSYDACIKAWDRGRMGLVRDMAGHSDAVRSLLVHRGRLFSGSYDHTVRVWDVHTLDCTATLVGHQGPVRTLAFAAARLFSASYDGTVRAWGLSPPQEAATLTGHLSAVRALAADHAYVYSGSDDHTVRVWDARTLARAAVLRGHTDNVRVLQMLPRRVLSGSWDRTVRVWAVGSWDCLHVLSGHSGAVLALATAPQPSRKAVVCSGSYDATVCIWDVESGDCLRVCRGHRDAVRALHVSGRTLVSGSYDGSVGFWSLEDTLGA